MDKISFIIYLKIFIFYASYLVFPLLYFSVAKRWKVLILFSLLFIYARFIEPNLLFVNHYKIKTGFKAKYALFSDIHLGLYNNEKILERIVAKINALKDIDAVLIAGDFTYEPKIANMPILFKPLSKIKVPVYAVLGNNDCEKPGPKLKKELKKILKQLNVRVLENESIKLKGVNILGLGSLCAHNSNINLISTFKKEDNLVVLTHDPDVALEYNTSKDFPDLSLMGHTHGGQIRIPYLYQKMIPIYGDVAWDQGLYQYKNTQVFVTSGIGMIGLPLRFLIPPVIDVLELY